MYHIAYMKNVHLTCSKLYLLSSSLHLFLLYFFILFDNTFVNPMTQAYSLTLLIPHANIQWITKLCWIIPPRCLPNLSPTLHLSYYYHSRQHYFLPGLPYKHLLLYHRLRSPFTHYILGSSCLSFKSQLSDNSFQEDFTDISNFSPPHPSRLVNSYYMSLLLLTYITWHYNCLFTCLSLKLHSELLDVRDCISYCYISSSQHGVWHMIGTQYMFLNKWMPEAS